MRYRLAALSTLTLVAMSLLFAPRARAFDTGPHFDLCREAMTRLGFNNPSINIVQINNWYVDFFSGIGFMYPIQADDCAKMHFDNMPTMDMSSTAAIRNYWSHLSYDTQLAVHQAVAEKNALKLLAYIGMTVHSVQDFYSHSNWVEQHERVPGFPYRTETWYNSQPAPLALTLRTGHYPNDNWGSLAHGDHTYGMNHDAPGESVARSRFDEAYTYAYIASIEWIQACHRWADEVDNTFWAKAQQFQATPAIQADIKTDLEAVYRLSEYASSGGHWKGPGSEDFGAFLDFSGGWLKTQTIFRLMYTIDNIQKLVSDGLTSASFNVDSPSPDPFRAANDEFGIVKLRTTRATDLSGGIDYNGNADFYPQIKIGGQWFIEAMQEDINDVKPLWTTLKFVDYPVTTVPIHYELWDEDGGANGADDHADINPIKNKQDLDFTFDFWSHMLAGDVSGVHDVTPVSASGEKGATDRCRVQFTVTGNGLDTVKLYPDLPMNATVNPTQVTITVTTKVVNGKTVYVEKYLDVPVTFHAVDATTLQPIQGYVYLDSPYPGGTLLGMTDVPFTYSFFSNGASHNVTFRVYAPGHKSTAVNVWVERIVQ